MTKNFGRLVTVYIEPKSVFNPKDRVEIGWAAPLPQEIGKAKEFVYDLQAAIEFAEIEKSKME